MRIFAMLIQCGVLGLVLTVWTATGSAASNDPVAVAISVRPSHIRVTISQPTPLVEVLGQLCRATRTDCQGTELASGSIVAPLTVDGNWEQVTSLLMDGAGLNYITIAPSDGGLGKLWITSLSTQTSAVKVATDCRSVGRRRAAGRAKVVSGQEDACTLDPASTSESRPPDPALTPAPENETSTPEVISDVQPGDAKSERGSGSPFPDGSGPSNSGTQSQSSGSPFPEALVTK